MTKTLNETVQQVFNQQIQETSPHQAVKDFNDTCTGIKGSMGWIGSAISTRTTNKYPNYNPDEFIALSNQLKDIKNKLDKMFSE